MSAERKALYHSQSMFQCFPVSGGNHRWTAVDSFSGLPHLRPLCSVFNVTLYTIPTYFRFFIDKKLGTDYVGLRQAASNNLRLALY